MATTVPAKIADLLYTKARSLVGIPVVIDDEDYSPLTDAPYAQVNYLPNSVDNLFLGNDDPSRHMGLLQITVVTPPGFGAVNAIEIAGEIALEFPKGLALREDGVTVKVYAKPTVARPMIVDFQIRVPITISWRSFN